ncbi:MAG: hypothetical protein O3B70_05365 [Bacteroidetes bacterium]|nr:hypothetical protein [Bacteroidota bacterium]MDA0903747.1 hypothetical protein [Bacteroidota bacterium]MDA1242433.1 hypothetical protein [Bacteroidota bacterium]
MAHPDIQDFQRSLVTCQTLLDEARMKGWTSELAEDLAQACLALHEQAILRKFHEASKNPETSGPEDVADPLQGLEDPPPDRPATNRLLTPDERGESTPEVQTDLISSIGEMTLAEKLALKPLTHVAEGMSIVDRAQYTSVLFSGDEAVFSALLAKLQRASTQEEAMALFAEALVLRGEGEDVDAMKEDFAKRILRTFVS